MPQKLFPSKLTESTRREDFENDPYYAGKSRLDHSTNAALIEDFYYYKLKINGKLIPSGFLKKETPDTRLATEIEKSGIQVHGNFEKKL